MMMQGIDIIGYAPGDAYPMRPTDKRRTNPALGEGGASVTGLFGITVVAQ